MLEWGKSLGYSMVGGDVLPGARRAADRWFGQVRFAVRCQLDVQSRGNHCLFILILLVQDATPLRVCSRVCNHSNKVIIFMAKKEYLGLFGRDWHRPKRLSSFRWKFHQLLVVGRWFPLQSFNCDYVSNCTHCYLYKNTRIRTKLQLIQGRAWTRSSNLVLNHSWNLEKIQSSKKVFGTLHRLLICTEQLILEVWPS